MSKAKKTPHPSLILEALPVGYDVIWEIFNEISMTRTFSPMGGASAISHTEIESYQRLMGISLSPSEVQLIRYLDRIYVSEIARDEKEIGKKFAEMNEEQGKHGSSKRP